MRIVTHEKLVRRNKQWAQYLFFASFGLLILGLFVTNRQFLAGQEVNFLVDVILPTAVLPLAFVLTMISVRMTNLWARLPRPETVIPDGLKGLNPKSVLFNYYHFPARHVLICPAGVFAIVTRFQDGKYTNQGDKWSTQRSAIGRVLSVFRFDAVTNPTVDALNAAQHVKKLLEPIASDVEVQPLIVFVDPKVQLTITDPVVPVVHANPKHDLSLKDYVQRNSKDKKIPLTPEQIEAFEKATTT